MATTPVVNPGGSSASASTGSSSSSGFNATLAAQSGANIYANMVTTTDTTSTTQSSPQDIASLVNATFQSLVGRNATSQEIQTYGAELLSAEKSNPGQFNELTKYGPTGKKANITGTQVSSGVDPSGFLATLIQGSGDAQSYKMATGYFDAMTQSLQQQGSE